MEIWKPIVNHEGAYEVSNLGRVRSLTRQVAMGNGQTRTTYGHLIKPQRQKNGYLYVSLGRRAKHLLVHRLVAEAFLPKGEATEVNHKNLHKTDNRATNLEWVTKSQNMQHAHDRGAFPPESHRRAIRCVEAGRVFDSSYQAAEWINAEYKQSAGSISCIAANIRTAKRLNQRRYGFHWAQVDEQPSTTIPKGSTPKWVEIGSSAQSG